MSNAGARWLWANGKLNTDRYEKGLSGKGFFMRFYNADCDKIAIENPIPSAVYELPKYTQTIEPYMFGHNVTKKTCLWLKGLPKLQPTNVVEPYKGREIIMRNGTKRFSCWTMDCGKAYGGTDRQRDRSKTFPGIANAMADQWGTQSEGSNYQYNIFDYLTG